MSKRTLITETLVREAARAGKRELPVPPGALITPLAKDTARELRVALVPRVASEDKKPTETIKDAGKTIAIASDHAGFEIKAAMIEIARNAGWAVTDLGTDSSQSVNYPKFAFAVARSVALGKTTFGLMIDGVGVGSAMVANKVPGVRAACCSVEFAAFNARAHNNANVLTLGSRSVGLEANKRILQTFLDTAFEGGRDADRVAMIDDVESRFLPNRDAL